MKLKHLTVLVFITFAIATGLSRAQACEPVEPGSLDYGEREDGRCEGISRTPIAGAVRLSSITIRGSSTMSSELMLGVPPTTRGGEPSVRLQSYSSKYQLDRIPWVLRGQYFFYWLDTSVLRSSETSLNSLRALAYDDHSNLALPVIIGGQGTEYEIVFWAQQPTRFSRFVIHGNNGQIYYETSRNSFENDEIKFTWDGKDPQDKPAQAGDYVIHYWVAMEQGNSSPIEDDDNQPFRHIPSWLQ